MPWSLIAIKLSLTTPLHKHKSLDAPVNLPASQNEHPVAVVYITVACLMMPKAGAARFDFGNLEIVTE